jgi:hypothetical protein
MRGGIKAHYDCIKALSETDFTEDLKKIDVPTLILHDDVARTAPATASNFAPTDKAVEADTLKLIGLRVATAGVYFGQKLVEIPFEGSTKAMAQSSASNVLRYTAGESSPLGQWPQISRCT